MEDNLSEIKTGWMNIKDAASVAGMTRANVYHWIRTRPVIRTRYVKARREIRIDDLLKAIDAGEPGQ